MLFSKKFIRSITIILATDISLCLLPTAKNVKAMPTVELNQNIQQVQNSIPDPLLKLIAIVAGTAIVTTWGLCEIASYYSNSYSVNIDAEDYKDFIQTGKYSLPNTYQPNAIVSILDDQSGELLQRTVYDEAGLKVLDIHFKTDAENPNGLHAHEYVLNQRNSEGRELTQIERIVFIEAPKYLTNAKVLSTNSELNIQDWTEIEEYLEYLENSTGIKISEKQRSLLKEDLKHTTYRKLPLEQRKAERKKFKREKNSLIKEWEKQTGQKWPVCDENQYSETGVLIREKGSIDDAHHIIENSYGGKCEWWNIVPARHDVHQYTIHNPNGITFRLFEQ